MNLVFQEEMKLIVELEKHLEALTPAAVSHALNQEFFYHASRELSNPIPHLQDPPSNALIASKILAQIAPKPDYDQLIDQLQHRISILTREEFDQLAEVRRKFAQEREQMRSSGARLKDFHALYEEEARSGIPVAALTKKALAYFETSTKDWPLEEVLADLIDSLEPAERSEDGEQLGEEVLEEEGRAELEKVMEGLRVTENMFNFEV